MKTKSFGFGWRCRRVVWVGVVLGAQLFCFLSWGAEVSVVAPGVWKIRIGEPEVEVPSKFRMFEADLKGLGELPATEKCPVDAGRIYWVASAKGLRVEMPYEGEVIYGLGLQVENFQQQGLLRFLMNNAAGLNGLGPTHAAFPYYVSAKGYAVYVDTARYTMMRIGSNARKSHALEKAAGPKSIVAGNDNDAAGATAEDVATDRTLAGKPLLVEVPAAQGVNIYVFAGPSMMSAVQRYNLFSGGGALPTLAGLAPRFRMESLASQSHVFELIRHFREARLPFTTVALEPGWHTKSYSCTYDWNSARYNHGELLAEFKKGHFLLDLWEHPYVHPTSSYYKSLYDFSGDYAVFGGLVPDLADAEAMKIYTKMHSDLIGLGARSFKIDANDNLFLKGNRVHPFPDSTQFPSGLDGEQMHQLFGMLTQEGVLRAFEERGLRMFGETRCSGAFAAPFPFVLFSDMGDQTDYYRMLLTGGFCGLLWQPEVRRASTNSFDEYYARIQMAVLSPALTFNNYMMPYPAWYQMNPDKNKARELYPKAEIVAKEDVVRVLLEQRMALVPYLYAAYREYQLTGRPPFRALVLDYPDDPKVAAMDDEMMIGENLLGYVFLKKAQVRKVYLPKGGWYDFNTGKRYEGGQSYEMKFSATMIPAFVKEGSILPLAKPVQWIDGKTVFEVVARVYGEKPASFVLYEDDGETLDYRKGAMNRVVLKWSKEAGGSVAREGGFKGRRYEVAGWEQVNEVAAGGVAVVKKEVKVPVSKAGGAVEEAIKVLRKAGVISGEDADYFRENAKAGGMVEGARMVPVFKAAARKLGGAAGDLREALGTLRAKKIISPTNKAWDRADQADDKAHTGGGTAMTLVKLAGVWR